MRGHHQKAEQDPINKLYALIDWKPTGSFLLTVTQNLTMKNSKIIF